MRDKSGNRFADRTGLAGLLDLTDGKPGRPQTTGRNGLWQVRGAWPDKATGRIIYLVRTPTGDQKPKRNVLFRAIGERFSEAFVPRGSVWCVLFVGLTAFVVLPAPGKPLKP